MAPPPACPYPLAPFADSRSRHFGVPSAPGTRPCAGNASLPNGYDGHLRNGPSRSNVRLGPEGADLTCFCRTTSTSFAEWRRRHGVVLTCPVRRGSCTQGKRSPEATLFAIRQSDTIPPDSGPVLVPCQMSIDELWCRRLVCTVQPPAAAPQIRDPPNKVSTKHYWSVNPSVVRWVPLASRQCGHESTGKMPVPRTGWRLTCR